MGRLLSILIVEDVDEMRHFLNSILSEVVELKVGGLASNTAEARWLISKNRPDWVLLDEVLPGESSIDLLKDLSAQGISVVLMTGMERLSPTLPVGASSRLMKPGLDSPVQQIEIFRNEIRRILKS